MRIPPWVANIGEVKSPLCHDFWWGASPGMRDSYPERHEMFGLPFPFAPFFLISDFFQNRQAFWMPFASTFHYQCICCMMKGAHWCSFHCDNGWLNKEAFHIHSMCPLSDFTPVRVSISNVTAHCPWLCSLVNTYGLPSIDGTNIVDHSSL